MQDKIVKKIALITGGSTRIGKEVALFLSENNWQVVIHYNHSATEAQKLCASINQAKGKAICIHSDFNKLKNGDAIFAEINSKIVHFYDYNNKEFDIDAERNSIANFSTAANKSYITPFALQGTSTFQLGNFRQKNKNTSNEFATVELDKNQRLSLGLAQNLKNYVFLNNFVTFKVQGATYRQAGKFIGINRENNKQPTLFDNKFLGVYLITGVKHIFEDAKYTNELVCVKTYIPQDIFLNKNIP